MPGAPWRLACREAKQYERPMGINGVVNELQSEWKAGGVVSWQLRVAALLAVLAGAVGSVGGAT
jgi:hypothetical protein